MRTRVPKFAALALVGALSALRCDCEPTTGPLRVDERNFAEGLPWYWCGMPLDCGDCLARAWSDTLACVDEVTPWAESWAEAAKQAGLTYDRACVDRIWTTWASECPSDPELGWIGCADECQFYHGDAGTGEACEVYGMRMSSCNQGLVCGVDRTCHEPCDAPGPGGLGEACGLAYGSAGVSCSDGLACVAGACIEAANTGEPCSPELACDSASFCDPETSQCQARLPPGAECSDHEMCEFGVCVDGACVAEQPRFCAALPSP